MTKTILQQLRDKQIMDVTHCASYLDETNPHQKSLRNPRMQLRNINHSSHRTSPLLIIYYDITSAEIKFCKSMI